MAVLPAPPPVASPPTGEVPDSRRAATRNPYSPVMLVVALIATIGVFAYAAFLLNPANRGDLLPWLLVIVAETILVFHAIMAMWTILSGSKSPRDYAFHAAKDALYDAATNRRLGVEHDPTQWPLHLRGRPVTVDVMITVYGEDLDVIRRTAEAALAIRGAHRTWILDDGRSDEVEALAAELGCSYIRRLNNHGAKAGNINNAMSVAKGEYFVILDADFVAKRAFLEETLPFMRDESVAFVQTPQTYGNLHNVISRGAGYMQTMFYRFIQPGRNQFNAAFCVGTNVLYRRDAVLDIGGIYALSKSEDVWTSLMLHERGWRSVYIPNTLAVGDAPETIEAYSKQQLRWATGGFEIMFTHNPLSPRRRLTLDQRLMYLVTATHYLVGIVPGLLLFVPALEIFFDLRPVNLTVGPLTWALFYSGFYVMQIVLAFFTLGSFRWEVLMLSSASFPIYGKALRNAFIGADTKWSVTGAAGARNSAFNYIIPQVLVFTFLLGASAVALWRDWSMQQFNIATFWNIVNTIALGTFVGVALAEDRNRGRATGQPADSAPTEAIDEPGGLVLDRNEIQAAAGRIRALADGNATATELPTPRAIRGPGADPYPTTGPLPVHLPSPIRPEDDDFGAMPRPMRAAGWAEDPEPWTIDEPTAARPAVSRWGTHHPEETR
ncbi:glycosyltransferase family 2 protein [Granulicoccus sp. GXG6511]|uniref:glycosyltransferase family 2 protein n=1 Tax=Granulicoccus sp. GXG6511 TaxID=3381351 RepID=UPI003D7C6C76